MKPLDSRQGLTDARRNHLPARPPLEQALAAGNDLVNPVAAELRPDHLAAQRFERETVEVGGVGVPIQPLRPAKCEAEVVNLAGGSPVGMAVVALDVSEVGEEQLVDGQARSEEHTSELQSLRHLVCRLLLEKKK